MKQIIGLLLVSILVALISCQKGDSLTEEERGVKTISFRVTNSCQYSIDDFGSSAATRATGGTYRPLAHLCMAVFSAETGTLVGKVQQQDRDEKDEYQNFSVSLPYGTYQILFVGYDGQHACQITSMDNVSFQDDYVPHCLTCLQTLTVNEGTADAVDVTLRRVVAAFRVIMEDTLPTNVSKLNVVADKGGKVLNAQTGFSVDNSGRVTTIESDKDCLGLPGQYITSYLFLPTAEETVNYTVDALDAKGNVIRHRQFDNVPMKINTLTTYSGKFFQETESAPTSTAYNVKWEMAWADTLQYAY